MLDTRPQFHTDTAKVLHSLQRVLKETQAEFTATDQLDIRAEESRGGVIKKTLQQLRGTGLFGLAVRDALPDALEATRRLARLDGSLAQIPQSHFVFSRYLTPDTPMWTDVREGTVLVANAQVDLEPVVVTPNGNGRQQLHGSKRFCTGSTYADVIAVVIQGEDVVFLPVGSTGLEVVDNWQAVGQEYTGSGTVRLNGVDIQDAPRYRLDGGTGDRVTGNRMAAVRHHGVFAQALHAAIDLGIFEGAVEAAYALAGVPRESIDPALAAVLGEVDVRLFAAQAAFDRIQLALERADRASLMAGLVTVEPARSAADIALEVTRAKLVIQDAALEGLTKLFEVAGSAGYLGSRALDRRWRDLRVHSLHDKRRNKIRLLGEHVGAGVELPLDGKLGG